MLKHWILDENDEPVEADLFTWATWFNFWPLRIIRQTKGKAGWRVSTVFLGLDHDFLGNGPPLLYESMLFHNDKQAGEIDDSCLRYSTRKQALRGHNKLVKKYLKGKLTERKPPRKAIYQEYLKELQTIEDESKCTMSK